MVNPDVSRSIGSIESKVDILLERTALLEERTRSLESTKNWLRGVAAALVVAWGVILKLLFEHK